MTVSAFFSARMTPLSASSTTAHRLGKVSGRRTVFSVALGRG